MNGRQWSNPDKLYDVFTLLSVEGGNVQVESVIPSFFEDKDILNRIPNFTYPCKYDGVGVELYTFVLTDVESKFLYGFCRFSHDQNLIMCILSRLPWFEVFYSLLNKISEVSNGVDGGSRSILELLEAVYHTPVPSPSKSCTVLRNTGMEFSFEGPDLDQLATIPYSRNLTEYYSAVDYNLMITVFTSILNERRLLVTSKKLSKLTACCHAAAALLYPCYWQHLFIPVLPEAVVDFVSAPMPYIIGVQESLMQKVRNMELDDAVILDLDACTFTNSFDDRSLLPSDWISSLKKSLQQPANKDSVSLAFFRCMARVVGGYRDGLKYHDSELEFNEETFISSTHSNSERSWRENISRMQYFSQFVDDRIAAMVNGETHYDPFDMEIARYYDDKNGAKYKEWISSVKKQGKKIKTKGQHTITDLSRKVQEKTKKAYKDMKTRLDDRGKKEYSAIRRDTPTQHKTIIGQTVRPSRPPRPRESTTGSFKTPITALSPRRTSYNNALKKYKHLSLSEEDLPSPGNFDLMNDPDLSNYLQKSYSTADVNYQESVSTTTPDTTSVSSLSSNVSPVPPPRRKRQTDRHNDSSQQLIAVSADEDKRQTDSPSEPSQRLIVLSSESKPTKDTAAATQGFEDNFVLPQPLPAVSSLQSTSAGSTTTISTTVAGSITTPATPARSSINDLMGLDLSPNAASEGPALYKSNPANSIWNKSQPNYHVSGHSLRLSANNPFSQSYAQSVNPLITQSTSSPSLAAMTHSNGGVPVRPPPPTLTPKPLNPQPTHKSDPLADLKW